MDWVKFLTIFGALALTLLGVAGFSAFLLWLNNKSEQVAFIVVALLAVLIMSVFVYTII